MPPPRRPRPTSGLARRPSPPSRHSTPLAISSAIASEAVAAGDGALSTCTARAGLGEHEVVDQRAVAADRLRADPARARPRRRRADPGHVPRGLAHSSRRLAACASSARRSATTCASTRRCRASAASRARSDVRAGAEQRRRAEQHVAADRARQVHAEERQRRVGHRVDLAAHQLAPLRPELQVGAAERDDAHVGPRARGERQPVRPRAGAGHRARRRGRPRRRRAPPPRGPRARPARARRRRAGPRRRAPRRRARRRPRPRRSRPSRCAASAAPPARARPARPRADLVRPEPRAAPARRWRAPAARARPGAAGRRRAPPRRACRSAPASIPCAAQYSYSRAAPSTHSRAFSEPGA